MTALHNVTVECGHGTLFQRFIVPCMFLAVVIAPRNVTVEEGHSALFQCFVPDADVIVWRKDGELLRLDSRKRVFIDSITFFTEGL